MCGCSVLTRPPSSSGTSVSSSTGVTGIPTFCRKVAVPPLATSSTSSSASPRANGSRPCLSYTESSARRITDQPADDLRQQAMLDGLDALLQRVGVVVRQHRHALGGDHGAGVDAAVDVVHGRRGLGHAGREYVVDRVRAGELRQRGGVRVHDAAGEALEEAAPQQVHVPGAHDQVDPVLDQPVGHRRVARVAVGVVVELESRRRDPGRSRPLERPRIGVVARDRDDRQALVDQRLQVRPLAADEHADHVSRPITVPAAASASGTTAHIPMPTLKTRRCSSSATPCSSSQS